MDTPKTKKILTKPSVEESRALCVEACAAIDALATVERYTPFSRWYRGEHEAARKRARKAVRALERCAQGAELVLIEGWLYSLRAKSPRSSDLRRALEIGDWVAETMPANAKPASKPASKTRLSEEELLAMAQQIVPGLETLASQNSDRLDIKEVSVDGIRELLEVAFAAGLACRK